MTDEQAQGEAFGNVDKFPKVQGRCPSCGRESLFLGDGGYVTCSIIGGCANPSAAHEALAPSPREVDGGEREAAVAEALNWLMSRRDETNFSDHLTETLYVLFDRAAATRRPTVSAEQVERRLIGEWHEDQCACREFDGDDLDSCASTPRFRMVAPMAWTVEDVLRAAGVVTE